MSQSRTLFIGMDVHTETIAVAYVAPEPGAAVTSLGTIGTRQCDIEQLLRKRPAKAPHRSFVYEAGPCGSWPSRYLRQKDDDYWVVAPSLIPKKAGDRIKTDHRDALQLARLARAGDLTAVKSKMKPCATSPGRVQMPSGIAQTPNAVSQPFCSATISATRVGPIGGRPTSGGSLKSSVGPRPSKASCKNMSAR
jgi:hypothetical protein